MDQYTVVFQPAGRRGIIDEGKTLLTAAQELGVGIEANCGGSQVCGKCRVIIEQGRYDRLEITSSRDHVSPITPAEEKFFSEDEINAGYRLACCSVINGDVVVTVPEESRSGKQVILDKGAERRFVLDPAVRNYVIEMTPATLEDIVDDAQRIKDVLRETYGLTDLTFDFTVLAGMSETIRKNGWKITATVWQDRKIIRISGGERTEAYGIAIDIGTTTLAAYLCNLSSGELLAKGSKMNPQIGYGEDILARISYAITEENGLKTLQNAIITAVNELVDEMTEKAGLKPGDVDEVVLVYNTAMHHIALGLNPGYMGKSPFTPVIRHSIDVTARDLGILINPAGNIHSLPVEAGFVGPDNVSVLIAEEPYNGEKVRLIIDIGTNGEIDLGNRERLLSTSCATGPALEGAQIRFGMRAAPGAIEKIKIDPATGDPSYKVIGSDVWYPENPSPGARGICGSGIIDLIAEMFRAGVINKAGRLNAKKETPRIRRNEENKLEYVLAYAPETSIGKDIIVTQGDVRAVQLAKAAIYVGAKYLMRKYGVDHLDEVTLAGAFGSYINKESAMLLGLFPDCDLEKVHAVGNAAGDGARLALLNKAKRVEADVYARKVEFVETAIEADFQSSFMEAIAIPHAKDEFPHLKEILDTMER